MNQYSLYGQFISETYPRLLQITSGDTVLDGSGDTRSLYVNGSFSADTIYLGPSDLHSIFAPISAIGTGATTFVRDGLNTYTGGTPTSPTINISAATLSWLNSDSISANTIYSGSTNLYDIFLTVSDGNDITRIQPGLNIYTGGTENAPTINISAATLVYLSANSISSDSILSGATNLYNIFQTIGAVGNDNLSSSQVGYGNGMSALTGSSFFTFDNNPSNAKLSINSPDGYATINFGGGRLEAASDVYLSSKNDSTSKIFLRPAYITTLILSANSADITGKLTISDLQGVGNRVVASTSNGLLYSLPFSAITSGLTTTLEPNQIGYGDITGVLAGSTGFTYDGQTLKLSGTANDSTIFQIGQSLLFVDRINGFSDRNGIQVGGLYIHNAPSASYIQSATGDINFNTFGSKLTYQGDGINLLSGGLKIGSYGTPAYAIDVQGRINSDQLSATTISGGTLYSGTTNLSDLLANLGPSTFVQSGFNTYTGGTSNSPTVNISAATLVTLSGGTVSGGTIYSGATNLNTVIDRFSVRVQPGSNIATGGTVNAPSISLVASPSFVGLNATTLSGGTLFSGTTNLSNTIISIANAAATANEDITRVQSGSNTVTGGTANVPSISIVASPSLNALTLSGAAQFAGVTSTGLSATTISANTIFSGTTNLSNTIISIVNATNDFTRVQNGSNTITGGTANAPSISIVASPSLNTLILSGTGQFAGVTSTGLSATTVSGGTLYSGGTNLSNTIISIANATNDFTRVQPGSNIATGGTANAPSVSIIASPSLNALTLSGAAQFAGVTSTGLSATTISGGTLYSGGTNLYNIFATAGSSGEANTASNIGGTSTDVATTTGLFKQKNLINLEFRMLSAGTNISFVTGDTITIQATGVTKSVQPGNNIVTGGTSSFPSVSVVSSPTFVNVTATTFYSGSTNLSQLLSGVSITPTEIVYGSSTSGQTSSNKFYFENLPGYSRTWLMSPNLSNYYYAYIDNSSAVVESPNLNINGATNLYLRSDGANGVITSYTNGPAGTVMTRLEANNGLRIGPNNSMTLNNASNFFTVDRGKSFFGGNSGATAYVDILGSITGESQFRIRAGVSVGVSSNDGDIWNDGTHLYGNFGGSIRQLDNESGATPTTIQNGFNTYTGGTLTNPTVNISAATLVTLSGGTVSGGTIYSGATNLSTTIINIANAAVASAVTSPSNLTRVQPGSNVVTGGTVNAPIVSMAASPSLNALTLSGVGQFAGVTSTGLSATTVSANTIFSGTTNLSNTIISIANAAALANEDVTRVQAASNIVTGGTANAPSISVVASPSFNALTLSGAGQFAGVTSTGLSATTISGGTIYSGATNLYSIFARPELVVNSIQAGSNIVTGGTSINPILSLVTSPSLNSLILSGVGQFAGVTSTGLSSTTISANTIFSGTTNLSNTIISIANAAALANEDMTRVQPGSNIVTGGTVNAPSVSIVTSPSLNSLILSGSGQFAGVTSTGLSATTISGGTIYSGATNLYSIFARPELVVNSVSAGSNVITGGTSNTPSISIVQSPSLNALTLSGAGQFAGVTSTGLSATTLSGGTIYSGSTPLQTIIQNLASGGASTFVQPGFNTYTGGTSTNPTVNISAATLVTISGGTVSGGTIFSGSTNLSNTIISIANAAAIANEDITRVQAGSNITTGGTANSPSISLVASPSLNGLTLSGAGQFAGVTSTGLSATTISGGTIFSGATNLYSIFARPELVVNNVQAGSNIITGGTANSPSISVVASPSLNALTLSGVGQFAGVTSTGLSATTISATTLFSGTTNLSNTIISIANAAAIANEDITRVQAGSNVVTGGTTNAPSISIVASPSLNALTLSGAGQFATVTSTGLSATTVSAGTFFSGSTPLQTIIQNLSSGGASTFVQPGFNTYTGGTSSAPTVNISAATLATLSGGTVSGGTLFSASTALSTIIDRFSVRVQPGTNTTTGGTVNAPFVNLIDSPSLNALILSGAGQFAGVTSTGLSATTISGGTIFSGATNLNTIIDRFSVRVQPGSNIATGGTVNAPSISIVASPSFNSLTLSGASQFVGVTSTGLSATTVSASTLFSGATNLYSIFAPLGSSGEANTASNTGGTSTTVSTTAALFKEKSGVDLVFRMLSAGTNISFITGDTITIKASSGSVTMGQATLNFGPISTRQTQTSLTVADTSVVSGTTKIIAVLVGDYTTDHPTAEEILLEDVRIATGNLVSGVGFDIVGYCPRGTYGTYKVNYTISY